MVSRIEAASVLIRVILILDLKIKTNCNFVRCFSQGSVVRPE